MVQSASLLTCFVAILVGVAFASFVEYGVHRLMHMGKFMGRGHAKHHRRFDSQGWWGEFTDYSLPGLLVAWTGFFVSVPAGVGFAVGTIGYAAFAAYAHQLQHEKPDLAFWLSSPIHYLHHRDNMWHHNFGIGVSFWDRILGTYRAADWSPEHPIDSYPLREFVNIRWR